MRDITERKRAEIALNHLALHDELTSLPNRVMLRERAERALSDAKRANTSAALLIMDLDRFKEVNDSLGHQSGDLLLKEVARRLREAVRETDTVSRLGGDEFAVVLPGSDKGAIELVVDSIQCALRKPFKLDGHRVDISASVGVAVFPEHGDDATLLMRHADVAMYAAKRNRAGHRFYAADQNLHSSSRLALTADLRRAVERGELLLHYQPKVDLLTGSTEQVEALVRWKHPDHGLVPPDEFIPLAEETGLIGSITIWVLQSALRQAHSWRAAGLDLKVAVNLSVRNLHELGLVSAVAEALAQIDIPASFLSVEITETGLIANTDQALEILQQLHDMGIKIAIDDFGTGYSSLAYLRLLPVDEIKIDRSFVTDMVETGSVIVRSMVDLGRNLGLDVTAEGVEDRETCSALSQIGCTMAQGYYLGRPAPAEDIVRKIQSLERTNTARRSGK